MVRCFYKERCERAAVLCERPCHQCWLCHGWPAGQCFRETVWRTKEPTPKGPPGASAEDLARGISQLIQGTVLMQLQKHKRGCARYVPVLLSLLCGRSACNVACSHTGRACLPGWYICPLPLRTRHKDRRRGALRATGGGCSGSWHRANHQDSLWGSSGGGSGGGSPLAVVLVNLCNSGYCCATADVR